VCAEGLYCVVGAAGVEAAAGADEGAEAVLVDFDGEDEKQSHDGSDDVEHIA
jgi:hypothetical protein